MIRACAPSPGGAVQIDTAGGALFLSDAFGSIAPSSKEDDEPPPAPWVARASEKAPGRSTLAANPPPTGG